jgi:hypothetical protein
MLTSFAERAQSGVPSKLIHQIDKEHVAYLGIDIDKLVENFITDDSRLEHVKDEVTKKVLAYVLKLHCYHEHQPHIFQQEMAYLRMLGAPWMRQSLQDGNDNNIIAVMTSRARSMAPFGVYGDHFGGGNFPSRPYFKVLDAFESLIKDVGIYITPDGYFKLALPEVICVAKEMQRNGAENLGDLSKLMWLLYAAVDTLLTLSSVGLMVFIDVHFRDIQLKDLGNQSCIQTAGVVLKARSCWSDLIDNLDCLQCLKVLELYVLALYLEEARVYASGRHSGRQTVIVLVLAIEGMLEELMHKETRYLYC